MTDELDKVMIFRRTRRHLEDGCLHCGLSRTTCDGLQDRRDGAHCCLTCEQSEGDPH